MSRMSDYSQYEFLDISNYSDNYTDYISNEPITETHLAIQEQYEYDGTPRSDIPQYITYIDHPTIVVEEKETEINVNTNSEEEEEREEKENLNFVSQFYFGSLTIIGLFIVFRILQLKIK